MFLIVFCKVWMLLACESSSLVAVAYSSLQVRVDKCEDKSRLQQIVKLCAFEFEHWKSALLMQWRIQGGSRFPRKPPFEIDFNPVSLSTLIEQSDRDSLIEQSDRKCYDHNSFIRNNCYLWEERLLREECEGWWPFFSLIQTWLGFFFCQAETETPFQKSWIRHCDGGLLSIKIGSPYTNIGSTILVGNFFWLATPD